MGWRRSCCPGRRTPTLYSSVQAVAAAEGCDTDQQVCADHHYTGKHRKVRPPGSGTAGHRRAGTHVLPPVCGRLSHSPARSDLMEPKTGFDRSHDHSSRSQQDCNGKAVIKSLMQYMKKCHFCLLSLPCDCCKLQKTIVIIITIIIIARSSSK